MQSLTLFVLQCAAVALSANVKDGGSGGGGGIIPGPNTTVGAGLTGRAVVFINILARCFESF